MQSRLETADKENSDLVMGGHVLSRIKRFILGSAADRVFRQAPYPVFIVRYLNNVSYERIACETYD